MAGASVTLHPNGGNEWRAGASDGVPTLRPVSVSAAPSTFFFRRSFLAASLASARRSQPPPTCRPDKRAVSKNPPAAAPSPADRSAPPRASAPHRARRPPPAGTSRRERVRQKRHRAAPDQGQRRFMGRSFTQRGWFTGAAVSQTVVRMRWRGGGGHTGRMGRRWQGAKCDGHHSHSHSSRLFPATPDHLYTPVQ